MSTDDLIGANLARIRRSRPGLSLRKLAEQLAATDRPINADGLNRAEKGRRQVSAAELVALAEVLDVSPVTLLMPPDGDPARWRWMHGEEPLPDSGADPEAFRRENRPYEPADPLRAAGDAVLRVVTRHNIGRMGLVADDGSVWTLEKVDRGQR
ncbi:helix-turn-helix transcriptional regulator [Micromonospora musae]|uniref:helix-turn-helix domain-containing protein n=1 Tax=Micromonospora musae TaxID=1894970 RepID=UPI0033FA7E5F